jgi:hypothetical protein
MPPSDANAPTDPERRSGTFDRRLTCVAFGTAAQAAFLRLAMLLAVLGPFATLRAQSNYATPYAITTLAGYAGYGSADGTGSAARFNYPWSVAVDGSGNVYVADQGNSTIRRITPAGVVTTFAGSAGIFGSADGTGSVAQFASPQSVAVDGSGNVYVADTGNDTIRKITSSGVVTTFAGTAGARGSADGTGAAAQFASPQSVAVDGSGNVYVADTGNDTIRKITSSGVVTTLAGTAGARGSADGTGAAARFDYPEAVAVDGSGNVYVADSDNCTIRRITSAGVVTTFAGTANDPGSADGTGGAAQFSYPQGVAADGAGNVYVADSNNQTIRRITPAGVVTTLAGSVRIPGPDDGTANAARFDSPNGLAVDGAGNVYVADTYSQTIRKVTPAGVVTTLAGTASSGRGSADGTGRAAQFDSPDSVAVDGSGNVYVADGDSATIRKITPAGVVTTFAGTAGNFGHADGMGSAAQFLQPQGVAVDGEGNVYVADHNNCTIRKITPAGMVTTLAGSAVPVGINYGSADGTGSAARFNGPSSLAVDGAGNVYVADTGNYTIRKITPARIVTTLAGTAGTQGSTDGTGGAASFRYPQGVAVDASGNVYVADTYNSTIRKITPAGVVTTLAGTPSTFGSADGTGSAARFADTLGVAVDRSGNIYVADGNSTIRRITPAGTVTTLAGAAGSQGCADGTGSAAQFSSPYGVAVDSSGNIYVADTNNNTIRRGVLAEAPQIVMQPLDETVAAGSTAIFSVEAASSAPLSYQWYFDGSAIPNATGAVYAKANIQPSDAGSYTVTVTNGAGSATSSAATLTVGPGASPQRLINISTRAQVGTESSVLIPGFVIAGDGIETLLIRADGPGLTQYGVPGVLAKPSLSVFDNSGKVIASNTVWGNNVNPDQVAAVTAAVGAFALPPGSADCALIVNLPAGAYTVQVSGSNGTTGVALAEIYEVSSNGTRLINISTRAQVDTGANIIIAGFVISGRGAEQLLVRGVGPGLTQFAVTAVLAQPSLSVFDNSGRVIASNTAWGTSANPSQISSAAASVGAFPLASGSADSAQIVSLSPGAYTMQISGVNSATGVALAEVYEVP